MNPNGFVDAASMTFEVIDVGQEIAFDIEDSLEIRRAIKAFLG